MSINVVSTHFCRQPSAARAFIKRTSFTQNEPQVVEKDSFLIHYGISGQKWYVRRYQNEDGSLTDEGRRHLGIECFRSGTQPRQSESTVTAERSSTGANKPSYNLSRQSFLSDDEKRERTKKLLIGLGAVAIAGISMAAAIRYRNTTNKLIQMAKNKMHDNYASSKNSPILDEQFRKITNGLRSRRKAKAVLGLRGRGSVKNFIKENNLRKMTLREIVEKRTGPIVEGYHRSKITGKMKPMAEWKRRYISGQYVRKYKKYL